MLHLLTHSFPTLRSSDLEYFQEWFPAAEGMVETARFSHAQGRLKDAAFLTHQATERLYHCVLLVCTFYTPHVHNLGFLRTQAERIDMRLVNAWPRETRTDRARFETQIGRASCRERVCQYV